MKRIILFSTPTPTNINTILNLIFPGELLNKVLAYMPSDGADCPAKYRDEWRGYGEARGAKFVYVDNSLPETAGEAAKLLSANILVITGGNTFKLLNNLRRSGLDKAIKEFARKDDFVVAGFSAGAIVLTPTIRVCNLPQYDENNVGIEDLTGLGLVPFEVFPHYTEEQYGEVLFKYRAKAKHEVKEITNEDYLVIDL